MKKNVVLITSIAVAGALGVGGVALGVTALTPKAVTTSVSATPTSTSSAAPSSTATTSTSQSTAQLLTYLIEEEKLAHDVYTVLAEKWGANTFTNILKSETSHQSQVASLLTAYGIADPRSSQIGVFTDPALQALYNKLIAQGSISVTEAYKVGVLIEETDIADLTTAMNSTTDTKILSVLQTLKDGSYNHLAAFQKQLA